MDTFICALGGFTGGALLAVLGVAAVIFVERRLAAWRAGNAVAAPSPTPQQAGPVGEDPHDTPAPLDRTTLAALIEAALDVQRQDRDMRQANTGYWGDTGYWVALAVREAEAVLSDPPETDDARAWLQSRRDLLARVHERYRQDADDPDGFGSATFHGLLSALDQIALPLDQTRS